MSDVIIGRDGAVLLVEFNRPEYANALSEEVVEQLLVAFSAKEAVGVELAVFSGRGANFCAGFDLRDLDQSSDADLMWRIIRIELLLQEVFHAPFVTLALAHGSAIGAGADLFGACAIRVASPGPKFRMPGWGFGIALGTRRLAHRVGADTARDLLLTSASFDSQRGHEIGFVQEVRPQASWPEARKRAELLASTLAKDSVQRLLALTTPETRDADMSALVRSACRPGLRERIVAYRRTVASKKK
jgi:enoyl-CoA hydratase/carnithine racemase